MTNLADELERLAKEATPGEWREWFTRRRSPEIYTDGAPAHSPNDLIGSTLRKGDAALIVALRNALPAILSALRREEWQGIATALADVAAERRRQVAVEGWAPEHDDDHNDFELSRAAVCYALAPWRKTETPDLAARPGVWWPWASKWWKPSDDRRDLVKAGALILAEIERLDRLASPSPSHERNLSDDR